MPFIPWIIALLVAVAAFFLLAARGRDRLAAVVFTAAVVLLVFVLPLDFETAPSTQGLRDAIWAAYATLPKISGMHIATISIILLIGMVLLLAIGMPLGFASGFLGVVVLYLRFGPDVLFRQFGTGPFSVFSQRIYGLMTDYVIISVPLFIFMASLLERSGLARDMYASLNVWLSRTRGGIALVTAIMAIIMAAMSGIIGGEVVLLGLIALPQMLRLGYNQNLAIGTICASGSLGTMIPPSIVLIIYGLVTETSIQKLFTAAFIPGFILASFYLIYIVIRTQLNPSLAPLPEPSDDDLVGWQKPVRFLAFMMALFAGIAVAAGLLLVAQGTVGGRTSGFFTDDPVLDGVGLFVAAALMVAVCFVVFGRAVVSEGWAMGKGLVAPMVVVFVVLGSIYGGVTGITEAAGMGVVAVILFIMLRGELTWELFYQSLQRTFKSTGTILMVTFGATVLAGSYSIAGGPAYVANLITGADLAPMAVIGIMMLIFLFLGALMDWVGIVLLVMPVFLPIILKLDLGMSAADVRIWFGILFCVNMQVSFLSPPFGPAAFYLKSVAPPHISLPDIFKGFLPFIGLQLLVLLLILFVPQITLLLV
ncbi:TRAP transporter large permease subunit [Acuticoccus sp. I52.16.1]|uniref:TRAP transporter large permease n=1 Tax=Acuticoccus sp. I52.16.1 TaxID=2928472 RepID=UPI001FCF82E0|nr:TRAP transporter large permease subunit [Acuticoccus sp. I52.16.1]UOM36193.1 TRAP transporter large permease subunit [Acuticoccus sp. I52.16.1]